MKKAIRTPEEMPPRGGRVAEEAETLIPAAVRVGRRFRYGFINMKGEMVISPKFDFADKFSDGLSLVLDRQKYGYININGDYIVRPRFRAADPFKCGFASVTVGKREGAIDTSGKMRMKPKFYVVRKFSEGVAPAATGVDNWGFIDQDGNPICDFRYEHTSPFGSGLARFQLRGCAGFLDRRLRVKNKPTCQRFFQDEFTDGMLSFRENGKWGYLNAAGSVVVAPIFERVQDFSEGLAWVRDEGKWGVLQCDGSFAVLPRLNIKCIGRNVPLLDDFENGYAAAKLLVRAGSRWGIMKPTGDFLIPPVLVTAFSFVGGLACIRSADIPREKGFSYVNTQGLVVFGPEKGRQFEPKTAEEALREMKE